MFGGTDVIRGVVPAAVSVSLEHLILLKTRLPLASKAYRDRSRDSGLPIPRRTDPQPGQRVKVPK